MCKALLGRQFRDKKLLNSTQKLSHKNIESYRTCRGLGGIIAYAEPRAEPTMEEYGNDAGERKGDDIGKGRGITWGLLAG